MREDSRNRTREIALGDDGTPSHVIYFLGGAVTAIYCPVKKVKISMRAKSLAAPTHLQGQYLSFIYYYSKLNGRPPAERDMERYFRAAPPAVHQMVLALEKKGFISRIPGQARSIQLRLQRSELPDLE